MTRGLKERREEARKRLLTGAIVAYLGRGDFGAAKVLASYSYCPSLDRIVVAKALVKEGRYFDAVELYEMMSDEETRDAQHSTAGLLDELEQRGEWEEVAQICDMLQKRNELLTVEGGYKRL